MKIKEKQASKMLNIKTVELFTQLEIQISKTKKQLMKQNLKKIRVITIQKRKNRCSNLEPISKKKKIMKEDQNYGLIKMQ